jgi:hypothetical protein
MRRSLKMFGSHPRAGGQVQYNAPANRLQESRFDRPARFVKIDATDPVMVAKARAAIAKLYARRGKTSPLQTFKNVRFSELETVFAWCWRGTELPDDDAGREDLYTAACHLWHLGRKHRQDTAIKAWAAEWAPWCGAHELSQLISQVAATPLKFKADPLAHRLGLYMTNQLRTALGLTTIGDIDVGKKGREKLRAERQKAWKQQNRRKNGATPRAEYVANSKSQTKPWDAEGISRATYFRRQKAETAQVGTSPGTPKTKDILLSTDPSHHGESHTESHGETPFETSPASAIIDNILVFPDLSHSESHESKTPWAAMGISRATYFRRRKAEKARCGTSAGPITKELMVTNLPSTTTPPEPAAPTARGRPATRVVLEGEIVVDSAAGETLARSLRAMPSTFR